MDVRLVVNQGNGKRREIPLPGTVFLIGRGQKCHLRPHCRLVSKLHCAIACWAGKVAVRDLNSVNGTYINNHPVRGEARVWDGDVLQVGSLSFTFRITHRTGDGHAVSVVRETDLSWLMESPDDSALLSPDETTRVELRVGPFPETSAEREAAASEGGNGKPPLSAGDLLRDYFRQRKAKRMAEGAGRGANPAK